MISRGEYFVPAECVVELSNSKQSCTIRNFLEADLTKSEWESLFSAVIFVDINMVLLFSCDFDNIHPISFSYGQSEEE